MLNKTNFGDTKIPPSSLSQSTRLNGSNIRYPCPANKCCQYSGYFSFYVPSLFGPARRRKKQRAGAAWHKLSISFSSSLLLQVFGAFNA